MDVPDGRPAHADGCRHIQQAVLHQNHVRRIHGHVGSRADGHADVRSGQGRRIVDAVAHHGNLALLLQTADDTLFPVGKNACHHLVHAGCLSDSPGRPLIVAGQHDNADAHIPQLLYGLGTVRLHAVGHGDDAQKFISPGEQKRCFALFCQRFRLFCHGIRHTDLPLHKAQASAEDIFPCNSGSYAVSGKGPEIFGNDSPDIPGFSFLHHGLCQRVFALLLQTGSISKEFLFSDAFRRLHVCHHRCSAGNGARFVQGNHIHPARLFQGLGGFIEDTVFCSHSVAHHDGHRRCETQRTGAADDQHRDSTGDGKTEVFSRHHPAD